MTRALAILVAFLALGSPAAAVTLAPREGDFTIRDFRFRSGETLPELRLHYTTLGTPKRDAGGRVTNAVMIVHGTGGDGQQFFRPQFADVLFTPGGLLDPAKYYIILPDSIGHGKSSKPSDGLRMGFPKYDYGDMVEAHHRLATEGLKVDRLRLMMGTSMGCMHAFVMGEAYPGFAAAMMPLACLPAEIAGRNRAWRKMAMEAIRADPAWQGGSYASQPVQGLTQAANLLALAGQTPLMLQKAAPTREAADRWVVESTPARVAGMEANDTLYQIDASRTYDPSKDLEKITVPVMWVNSADDFINPPELGIAEQLAPRLAKGRYVLLPISDATRGHSSHTWAVLWKDYLAELLARSE